MGLIKNMTSKLCETFIVWVLQ